MFHGNRAVLAALFALFVLSATPHLKGQALTANATLTCSAYSLSVSASNLIPGTDYQIDFTIAPSGAAPITSSIPFNTGKSDTFNDTITGSFPALNGTVTFSGAATLDGSSAPISFSPTSLTCGAPPPPPCTAQSTNASNFNGTPINSGEWIWFNSNFTVKGIPSTGATITFTNSTISSNNGMPFTYSAPNAQITFSPSATCSSTTFNAMTNTWMTTVPVKGDDEIFLSGLAVHVPFSGMPGGNDVSWTGTFSTNGASGVSIDWKWGAAVYSTFTTDYNALAVKSGHHTACGQNNGDHAGTPEGINNNNQPWKQFVRGGARGGGGSNWTGSWSGTQAVVPACHVL